MNQIRPAAVAGMFYPGAANELAADVRAYLVEAAARGVAAGASWPKALIVPHAGYMSRDRSPRAPTRGWRPGGM